MAARGIPSLPAPNMARTQNFQQGGIVPTKPKPKPTLGAMPETAVDEEQVKYYAKEYLGLKRSLEDPSKVEFRERNKRLLQELILDMGEQMPTVMQYIDSLKGFTEPRTKMFREGGGVGGPPIFRSEDPEMMRLGQSESERQEAEESNLLRSMLGGLGALFRPSRAQQVANRIERAQQQELGEQAREAGIAAATFKEPYDPNRPKKTQEAAPRQAGLGALGDKVTALRGVPFRMKGVEDSGMRTPQDYLADVARRQAEQGTTAPEAATAEERPVSRYQEELDRLTARQEDPMRQLETFLSGIASGRGRGVGQSLAAGAQALRAAEDQIDARRLQLVEALQREEISAAEAAREMRRLDLMAEQNTIEREYNQQRIAAAEQANELARAGQLQEARQAALEAADAIANSIAMQASIRQAVEASDLGKETLSEEGVAGVERLIRQRTQEIAREEYGRIAQESGLNDLATATSRTFGADEFAEEMTITE